MMVRRSVACLASVFLLAGCAGLPASSSVDAGKVVTAERTPEPLTVMPDGPLPDDDPRGIVTGFMRAQMWRPNGYELARSFLTSSGSQEWKPGASVTIFDESAGMSVTRPQVNMVRARIPVVGTVSADGHLTRTTSPQWRMLDFTASHERAGWRLAHLPQGLGLWLDRDDFTRLYRSVNVYYPSAFGHVMVPDPRWLPRQGLATALARAALSAPPQWLAPAVHAPFPQGTALGVEAVPISDKGRADIDLSDQMQKASTSDRAGAWAAMVATVTQAPEVTSVSVLAKGTRLETENLPSTVRAVGDVGYQMPENPATSVIARGGTYLAWTDPASISASAGESSTAANGRPPLPAIPSSWSNVAAGPGGRQIAAVSHDRTALRRWLNGSNVTLSALGTDLVRPAFDPFGFLWCAGHAFANQPDSSPEQSERGPASVWAFASSTGESDGAAAALAAPWLGQSDIVAFSISPEGERLAMVLREGQQSRVVVAAIRRSSSGAPSGLGQPLDVPGLSDPTEVTWLDADHLGVLTQSNGTRAPMQVSLDGYASSLGQVPGAASMTSTRNGAAGLFVTTGGHSVYTRRGAGWTSFLTGGDVIVPAS